MSKILIVSNRLPVTTNKSKEKIKFIPSGGGLATGMSSFSKIYKSQWVGWPGVARDKIDEKDRQEIIIQLKELGNYPVCTD
jgi:trehalose 6-phosphate synthase/phosphatase